MKQGFIIPGDLVPLLLLFILLALTFFMVGKLSARMFERKEKYPTAGPYKRNYSNEVDDLLRPKDVRF